MNNFFFIILLSSLYFVFNVEYDLTNGDEKIVIILEASQTYNFYIPMTQFQKADITLTFKELKSLPFSSPKIYEYSIRNSSSYIRQTNTTFSTSTKNNQLIATSNYIARQYSISYLALEIKPISNIKNMSIKINIDGGAYEMSEGQSKTIYNLFSNFTYLFFIPVNNSNKMTLNLTTNYNDKNTSFNYVTIYEFKDTILQYYLYKTTHLFNYDMKNNETIISIDYLIQISTIKMIGILIVPNFNIEYITALINFDSYHYHYNLYDGYSNYLSGLKANNSYKFYIQTHLL